MVGKTLYDKLWDMYLVKQRDYGLALIYTDHHILHEVTSPQAFEGLRLAGRKPWRIDVNIATPDHNVPTARTERKGGIAAIADEVSRLQAQTLNENRDDFGITEFKMNDVRQGVVHVIGPEQGVILLGMAVVCGDSHTPTHDALGTLVHGIGTSGVEHVLATQYLVTKEMKNMLVKVEGGLSAGVTAKDIVLAVIGRIGTVSGNGHVIEFAGDITRDLPIEGRMAICSISTETGARVGLVAADQKTIDYVEGRLFAPSAEQWGRAVACRQGLMSDVDARFDTVVELDAAQTKPQTSWGTSPEMVLAVDQNVLDPVRGSDPIKRGSIERALKYMGLRLNQAITDVQLNRVFIGSCINSRIEDLRAAVEVARGRKVAAIIRQALVVPGSGLVKEQVEKESLDRILIEAGSEQREPGCSMRLAMNPDRLENGEHCVSASNRNFESRQGTGGRTHSASPAMAAAAVINSRFIDARELLAWGGPR